MMKILRAVAFAAIPCVAATVHAAPASTAIASFEVSFQTWQMANFHDVTQAWYFTGEALAGPSRDGAPWAAGHQLFRPADAALPASAPAVPVVPARVDVPPTIPEPPMASMLLVGVVLIFLRMGRREEQFG